MAGNGNLGEQSLPIWGIDGGPSRAGACVRWTPQTSKGGWMVGRASSKRKATEGTHVGKHLGSHEI